ncbi:exo-beta-N-acetylmuramidase NamZ family protein [Desulfoluna spongiiphila]|uniref:exo-beta-N-acetylmuramidase NamZ family protein n=1 Tax=Desulfoluna spongiiphila TaxID=419481 RepID=UPI00125FFB0A|nr:DUF1343 domain-containing protein [Desulfoluna spongiiphila]
MSRVRTGLEHLLESPPAWARQGKLALLANPASVGPSYHHARDLISEALPSRLGALYSPQHGFFADKQDNMIESGHGLDPVTGVPVFSLYGETRWPTDEMLDGIDTVVVDIQDVGTRVYTFIWTLTYIMEAAAEKGFHVAILDRPNPIGGIKTEGNLTEAAFTSFVGRYPIPMRHGMTMGELALFFNERFGIGCDLTVVPMKGWTRSMHFGDTGLPWVLPSPNMPCEEAALVYPGQVILEGCNLSEGRGTTRPFELFGAPYLDTEKLLACLTPASLAGCTLRETGFEPTFGKWQGELCRGFQIHVTDRERFSPYRLSLDIVRAAIVCHPNDFAWKEPPYEYEYEKCPMDMILGSKHLRECLENGVPVDELEKGWQDELNGFDRETEPFLIYPTP